MTKPDYNLIPIPEIGDLIGVWQVTDLVPNGQGVFVTCTNCGKDQIFNRREALQYLRATCHYTRCSAFSVHHTDPETQARWLAAPNHLAKIR
jgi:hypothetical protein